MIILFIIIWMAIGASAFIWYWTRLYDFETSELWLAFGYSIMGVGGLMIVVCLWIEDRSKEKRKSKVLIKKQMSDQFKYATYLHGRCMAWRHVCSPPLTDDEWLMKNYCTERQETLNEFHIAHLDFETYKTRCL